MKNKRLRRVSVPSTALLGSGCEEVQPVIAVWPTSDGIGGRNPTRADTVHVLAFARGNMTLRQCEAAGLNGGASLIGKTTIRDMVRYEVEAGIIRGTGKLDTRYARRFALLRDALLGAAQDIADVLPNASHEPASKQERHT
jgi:hypothetical protein